VELTGLEPATPGLQSRCSTTELQPRVGTSAPGGTRGRVEPTPSAEDHPHREPGPPQARVTTSPTVMNEVQEAVGSRSTTLRSVPNRWEAEQAVQIR